MSQSVIKIETSVYERTKLKAEEAGMSVSNYIADLLDRNDKATKGHAMRHCGIITDETFVVPDEIPWSLEIKRETL